MKDPTTQWENTDELPVLSEEAISQHRDAETAREIDMLAREIEALRRALEGIEKRWHDLEAQFRVQQQTLLQLGRLLQLQAGAGGASAAPTRPRRWRRGTPLR